MADENRLNIKPMNDLMKALKVDVIGRIGVLGDKNARTPSQGSKNSGDVPTNADIGFKHEYGIGVTKRSWLRVPLAENLDKFLEANGGFNEDVMKRVIANKNIKPWMKLVMATAEEVVLTGFDTGGFGKWRPSNMAYKKNHQTLVETGQLRDAVSTEIQGGD